MTTLLKLHDVSDGMITRKQLEEVASAVSVPLNDTFGECLPWVIHVVKKLDEKRLIKVTADTDALQKEFEEFSQSNRAFATSTRFPNVKVSEFCS